MYTTHNVPSTMTVLVTILVFVSKSLCSQKTSKTGGVDKFTDSKTYTGSHKERFDESGKGRGAEGRTDKVENTGYTGQYKNKGTYDKKH